MNYEVLADSDAITRTIKALSERSVEAQLVNNRAEALEKVKSLIPKDASVMNGSSRTLQKSVLSTI